MSTPDQGRLARAHRRFGWTALLLSFALGAAIEGMLGLKLTVIHDPLRHDLWTLAHFHLGFLGLLNLVYPVVAAGALRHAPSTLLLAGSAALPIGFFLGGIGHPEGDPSAGIVLAPIGALLATLAVLDHAVGAWRER